MEPTQSDDAPAIDDGGPAFPQSETSSGNSFRNEYGDGGMSLRDWFAGQALKGMLTDPKAADDFSNDDFARNAYWYADAMIRARDPARAAGGVE